MNEAQARRLIVTRNKALLEPNIDLSCPFSSKRPVSVVFFNTEGMNGWNECKPIT